MAKKFFNFEAKNRSGHLVIGVAHSKTPLKKKGYRITRWRKQKKGW